MNHNPNNFRIGEDLYYEGDECCLMEFESPILCKITMADGRQKYTSIWNLSRTPQRKEGKVEFPEAIPYRVTPKKMTVLERVLLAIPYFLLWVLYLLFTMNARTRYMQGMSRGMHCYESKDVSRLLPGSVTEFRYDPFKKPEREYVTWKQFWQKRGY